MAQARSSPFLLTLLTDASSRQPLATAQSALGRRTNKVGSSRRKSFSACTTQFRQWLSHVTDAGLSNDSCKQKDILRIHAVGEQGWLEKEQELEACYGNIALSPNGRWRASGTQNMIRIFRMCGNGMLQQVQQINHPDGTDGADSMAKMVRTALVTFSPDGHWLASTGDWGGTIRIWAVNWRGRLKQVLELKDHFGWVTSMTFSPAFSPDGPRLASGNSNHTVWIWATNRQGKFEQVQELKGPLDVVRLITFSPNVRWLAASDGDRNTIWIWATDEQGRFEQVQELNIQGGITSIAFSANGRWLAVGCEDENPIQIWTVEK